MIRLAPNRKGTNGVDEIAAKIIRIIGGHLGIDPTSVLPEASLVDDLGADSLDTVELVIAFEAAFNLEIAQDDVDLIRTVQDAIDYIDKRRTDGQGSS